MTETVDGITFEYQLNRYVKDGGGAVVFLHGWGGDIRSFSGAYKAAEEWGVPAINFAFPKIVPKDYGIYDYAAFLKSFLDRHGIKSPTLVGHSFGGRVAIILASQGFCGRLVLVDSAGMKPRFKLSRAIKIARYKASVRRGKPLDGTGSVDYNNTEPEMRAVFVRIVNTFLERLLPYIKCPTLILWGKSDKDTPPYMARRLARGIKDSELIYINGGHYAYAQSDFAFKSHLKSFITE